jgi:alpha-1,2-glucosyltransferase
VYGHILFPLHGALCSLEVLRSLNLLFCLGNYFLFYAITRLLHPSFSSPASKALLMAIFPPLFFFSFLFYTDVGSTFFVLLMYYLSLRSRHSWAALAGLFAFLFRQTNVVWVAFTLGCSVIERFEKEITRLTG